jgi:hypothetical protein
VVTFTSWRVILWIQVAMVGIGFMLAIFFVPASKTDLGFKHLNMSWRAGLASFNPLPVFRTMKYPNVVFIHFSCGLLSWAQYFLLAAPRQILQSQFHLTSPLASGLFYIAPAIGFLLGTVLGGRYSDMTVRKWIVERGGHRLPQDRLKSGMLAYFLVIPSASLAYGWGLQYIDFSRLSGGLAFPIVLAFFTAAGILAAFASLNTYCAGQSITIKQPQSHSYMCLEALPKKRREVIAGKYFVQYIFGACACAGTEPLLSKIHVGPASTVGEIESLSHC